MSPSDYTAVTGPDDLVYVVDQLTGHSLHRRGELELLRRLADPDAVVRVDLDDAHVMSHKCGCHPSIGRLWDEPGRSVIWHQASPTRR